MRYMKKLRIGILIFSLMIMATGQTAFAADEEYTYTVRLYAGNLGALTGNGIEITSDSASMESGRDQVVITGLKYGDTVRIIYQNAADSTDERYYVRGVRRSGRDNSEAEAPTFHVACDRDYVVAYGVRGDMVAYTVNYLDEDGNPLMDSDTYYGNAGERQYVSSRYIDGYQPQALNMVMTLSSNEAENVFNFRYTAVEAAGTPGTGATGMDAGTTGTARATGAAGAGAGADAGAVGAGAGADAGVAGADAGEAEQTVGGDAGVQIPDGEVPQAGSQDLVDLDDEGVPLASMKPDHQGIRMGYLPIYIGIGVVAAAALILTAIYLKRRKPVAAKSVESMIDDVINHGK